MRKMLTLFLFLFIIALLAAAAFFLLQRKTVAPISQPSARPESPSLQDLPVAPEDSSSSAAQEKEPAAAMTDGWCCRIGSAACARAADAALCLRTGGRAFDMHKERCFSICTILSR